MLSIKQQEYLNNCNHRWNLKIGATGSGKTWIDYNYVIPERALNMRGEGAGIILGHTRATAWRNVIEPLQNRYGMRLVGKLKSDSSIMMFGQKFYVLGADKDTSVAKIQGLTVEYAYGDEITTWSEKVFQMLKSRLRCEHSHFDGTANPASPQHFLKEFIDSGADVYCQKSTLYDNPYLPPEVVDALEKEYAGTVYFKRYILGEWALAEGLIYPAYTEALADCVFYDDNDDYSESVVSIDYGTQNAFSAILWGEYNGVWYAYDEYYYSGRTEGIPKTDEEYAEDLDKFTEEAREKLAPGKRLRVIIDPSAASFKTLLQKRGWYKVTPANNDVADGIRETSSAMKTGRIKISPACKAWQKEASGYSWDDKSDKDVPIKENDHAMDATRYFVRTMHINKKARRRDEDISGSPGSRR